MSARGKALAVIPALILGAILYWQLAGSDEAGSDPAAGNATQTKPIAKKKPVLRRPIPVKPAQPDVSAGNGDLASEGSSEPSSDLSGLVESDPAELEKARVAELVEQTVVLYDRSDYARAVAKAKEVLQERPDNIRALSVLISSSCILGDGDTAREHFARLERAIDREPMETVCAQHGVEL